MSATINKLGKSVTQIIHFVGGEKRTFNGLLPKTIKQGQFTKVDMLNGGVLMVNDKNVLCVEVFPDSKH